MTATIDPATTMIATPTRPAPAPSPSTPPVASRTFGDRLAAVAVWRVAALAGVTAAVAVTAVAGVAELAGVPMEAAEKSAPAGEHIPLYAYAFSTLMSVAVGTLIAAVLYRKASRPARAFTIVALALTALSFGLPHTTGHATTATRLVLDLTHVVAAAIVIPAIAHRLGRRPARAAGTTGP
jgi:peptidoglycan/LPS O-acetylase OafA/YrhL